MLDTESLLLIENRIGTAHFKKRLQLQAEHSAIRFGPSGLHIYWENLDLMGPILRGILKMSGVLDRGMRNSLNYRVETLTTPIPHLPSAFHGFRILHLSDLHLEGILDRGKRLREVIHSLTFDLCVITGDFRLLTYGDYEEAVVRMTELATAIQCPEGIIGILGNHDFLEMIPGLEKTGMRLLLNESIPIHRGEDTIWIVGVDDTHWYEVDDLPKALQQVPREAKKILLAHSPEIIQEASEAGIDYYLCGHSHGGQICLPGGIPILNNSLCSRSFIAGSWSYQNTLPGYTSRGTGTSLLPVRFSCPPEVALHELV